MAKVKPTKPAVDAAKPKIGYAHDNGNMIPRRRNNDI